MNCCHSEHISLTITAGAGAAAAAAAAGVTEPSLGLLDLLLQLINSLRPVHISSQVILNDRHGLAQDIRDVDLSNVQTVPSASVLCYDHVTFITLIITAIH